MFVCVGRGLPPFALSLLSLPLLPHSLCACLLVCLLVCLRACSPSPSLAFFLALTTLAQAARTHTDTHGRTEGARRGEEEEERKNGRREEKGKKRGRRTLNNTFGVCLRFPRPKEREIDGGARRRPLWWGISSPSDGLHDLEQQLRRRTSTCAL